MRVKRIWETDWKKYLFLFFGIVAAMPIIRVSRFTAFVWGLMALFFAVIGLWFWQGKFRISKYVERSYLLMATAAAVSYLLAVLRMQEPWSSGLMTSLIQFFAVLVIYMFFSEGRYLELLNHYVKGIYYSAVIQTGWAFLQLFLWKLGIDLNNLVFRDLFHFVSSTESATHIQQGALKLSGFCWNGANLAPLVIFGFFYTKNPWMQLVFIAISFLSGSRTLMFAMLFALALKALGLLFVNKKTGRTTAFILISAVILGGAGVVVLWDRVFPIIQRTAALMNVFKNVSTEGSTNTHAFYLTSVFSAARKNDLLSNLFGYGPGNSGYVFTNFFGYYPEIGKWAVECDYIDRLWAYGFVGFILYYYWYLRNIFRSFSADSRQGAMFLVFLLMGFMYNITFNWVALLVMFIFILNRHGVPVFEGMEAAAPSGDHTEEVYGSAKNNGLSIGYHSHI